jgi:hypothetical protein
VPEPIVYDPADRPDIEVLWAGAWCPGELRMQSQDDAGRWFCQVQYRRPGETSSHIDTFLAERVRPDTVDRSQGREGA